MKRILVIGSGGREAAIVQKLCDDSSIGLIVCSPGSAGIQAIDSRIRLLQAGNFQFLRSFALAERIDLTIVGPEQPLVDGIVDYFNETGLKIVGPSKFAAQLEGSKVFCKQLLRDNKIPTADFDTFDNPDAAKAYIRRRTVPIVVKADGLAGGKGVTVALNRDNALVAVDTIMIKKAFGAQAGARVVIEEYLTGRECSIIALADGKTIIPFIPVRDYKPAYNQDQGPNTGGMGGYTPVPMCTPELRSQIVQEILSPTMEAMRKAGHPYQGVIYAGIMLTAKGPKILEFNVRFGDPEAQLLMALLNSNLLPLLEATVDSTLDKLKVFPDWLHQKAVCVVLATPGYPGNHEQGLLIEGIEDAKAMGVKVIHAGTERAPDGFSWVTKGGRVLNIVATGIDFNEARACANEAARCITFGGKKPLYRSDIAQVLD